MVQLCAGEVCPAMVCADIPPGVPAVGVRQGDYCGVSRQGFRWRLSPTSAGGCCPPGFRRIRLKLPCGSGDYWTAWQVLQRFAARTMRPHLLQRLVFLAILALVCGRWTMGESPGALHVQCQKSLIGTGVVGGNPGFSGQFVCHPGPVRRTSAGDGQTSGIPRVGQCIVVNRPKQSRFPGEYLIRQSRSFVSGKSVT